MQAGILKVNDSNPKRAGSPKNRIPVKVIAIDPGTTESGICVLSTGLLHELNFEQVAKLTNDQIMARIRDCNVGNTHVVIEGLPNQGGTFGYDLIETGYYIGSLRQMCEDRLIQCFIYRRFEYGRHFVTEGKLNDATLRAALETIWGTSAKKTDPLYALRGASDKRSAFALAKYHEHQLTFLASHLHQGASK